MVNRHFLPFEQPIAELEAKINELRLLTHDSEVNLNEEIERLTEKCDDLTRSIFSGLTPWEVTQVARHPMRPHSLDYNKIIFVDFDELHGDRHYSIGPSIVAGIARLDDKPVMVMGHEKGSKTKEKLYRNFGMAQPEDYRKALRLMKMAEKFSLPVFTFIDTAGAYPGINAEEHNQSEAIARNLVEMTQLKVPIICTVIGEGGSGGALAIGVGDRVLMMQYSIYSVISPEGCASILWKDTKKAKDAARAMGITSERLLKLGLIDAIIPEPLGGAHRDTDAIIASLKQTLIENLQQLESESESQLLAKRYHRVMSMGIRKDK